MDEKLIELVRKCEELYDISNEKYSDSVWKEKLWGQIGEVKESYKFQCSFIAHIVVTIILLSPNILRALQMNLGYNETAFVIGGVPRNFFGGRGFNKFS
jgi:hypothetical protein